MSVSSLGLGQQRNDNSGSYEFYSVSRIQWLQSTEHRHFQDFEASFWVLQILYFQFLRSHRLVRRDYPHDWVQVWGLSCLPGFLLNLYGNFIHLRLRLLRCHLHPPDLPDQQCHILRMSCLMHAPKSIWIGHWQIYQLLRCQDFCLLALLW